MSNIASVVPIRVALLSVYDKTGIIDFARELANMGVHLLSTGGTAKTLSDANIAYEPVEDYTQAPEMLRGRVKTLHPKIHAGILIPDVRDGQSMSELDHIGAKPIDLVVVNLYPFEETRARLEEGGFHTQITEHIDIGGVALLRSAGKTSERVTVVPTPADYSIVLDELHNQGGVSEPTRLQLAAKSFAITARYESNIASYMADRAAGVHANASNRNTSFSITADHVATLRYGENPHQEGELFRDKKTEHALCDAENLGSGGKILSYNNYLDVQSAVDTLRTIHSIDLCSSVIVKHGNASGIAIAKTRQEAFVASRNVDRLSAFGGVIALSYRVDEPTARLMSEDFFEVCIAPEYDDDALSVLRGKKNVRILRWPAMFSAANERHYVRLDGAWLRTTADTVLHEEVKSARTVSIRSPTTQEWQLLDFSFRAAKCIKSNAIVLASHAETDVLRTVGIGAGQMSRVLSVEIAIKKAQDLAKGSVLASDGFFPFEDAIELAAAAGVTAIVQPGGSVNDERVIKAANAHNLAMVCTGRRHFRH